MQPAHVPTRHRRPWRDAALRIRNWRVRRKLAAVLLIPTIAFIVVGGLDASRAVTDASRLATVAARTADGDPVVSAVHELQRERDRTAGYIVVAGRDGREAATTKALGAALDADIVAVDAAVAAASRRAFSEPAGQRAEAALDELPSLRSAARNGGLRQRAVFDEYTQIIGAVLDVLLDSTAAGAGAAVDDQLAQDFRSLADLYRAEELEAQVRGRLYAIASTGVFSQGEFQSFADLRAQRADAIARFRANASGSRLSAFDNLVKGQATLAATRIEQTAVDRSQAVELGIDPEQWWSASTTKLELVHGSVRLLFANVVRNTDQQSSDRQVSTTLSILLIVLILVIAVLASLSIGRSMVRSLGSLRSQAHDVARQRLPEVVRLLSTPSRTPPKIRVAPTTVDSLDEIGEVADAFDAVHREAVRLATAQAVLRRSVSAMFVSLARRSQALVERQLGLIDTLEEFEEDPDQLGYLFKLDHLATRMRRNNDNLLVIAGGEALRRSLEPVPIADVLLAAMAEIEQYTRVQPAAVNDRIAVVGHAAPDLVHLLAELIDNATAFSPPHSTVHVAAHLVESGVVVTVEDNGVGMAASRLALVNHRLAAPAGADASVPEQMGLFVVANLGARHGIRTELHRSPRGGTLAATWLPRGLLTAAKERQTVTSSSSAHDPGQRVVRRSKRRGDLTGVRESAGRAGLWWSREAAAAMAAARAREPGVPAGTAPVTFPTAITAGINRVGLPIRVPMTARPPAGEDGNGSAPAGAGGMAAAVGVASAGDTVEPARDSAKIAALYRGIREAVEPTGTNDHAAPSPIHSAGRKG
jgi:signal transduction histidine kinase